MTQLTALDRGLNNLWNSLLTNTGATKQQAAFKVMSQGFDGGSVGRTLYVDYFDTEHTIQDSATYNQTNIFGRSSAIQMYANGNIMNYSLTCYFVAQGKVDVARYTQASPFTDTFNQLKNATSKLSIGNPSLGNPSFGNPAFNVNAPTFGDVKINDLNIAEGASRAGRALEEVVAKADWLRSLTYPIDKDGVLYPPPEVIFLYGNFLEITGFVTSVNVEYSGPIENQNLAPMYAKVTVNISQNTNNRPAYTQSDVVQRNDQQLDRLQTPGAFQIPQVTSAFNSYLGAY